MPKELLAGRGQPCALAAAFDQPHPGQRFKLAQRFGDGRLAQVQPFGRTAQVAFLGNGDKAAEMAEADARQQRLAGGGRIFHNIRLLMNRQEVNLLHFLTGYSAFKSIRFQETPHDHPVLGHR